jgi:hypothetical protein
MGQVGGQRDGFPPDPDILSVLGGKKYPLKTQW